MQPNFFVLLVSLYVFISSKKAHVLFIHKQSELHPTQPKWELQRLSDTRWACSYSAVNTMCHTFYALLATLVEIVGGNDHGNAVDTKGLLLMVKSFSFLLLLIIFDRVPSLGLRILFLKQYLLFYSLIPIFLPIILSNFRLFPIFYLLFFARFPNLMHKKKDYTN